MSDTPEKKKQRKWLRRLVLTFLVGLFLLGALFMAVQTPPAKRFMAARINGILASSLPWPAELSGIGGFLPFVVTVEEFRLGAAEDPWFELHDVSLNTDILPLLGGNVSLERLSAGEVILHRLPPPAEEVPDPEPFALPMINDLPTWVRLGDLQIDRVAIGEEVAGEALAFSVVGAYRPEEDKALSVEIHGLDGAEANVQLVGDLRGGDLALSLELNDETLLSSFADLEGPVNVALSLDGPLTDVVLHLEATRRNAPLANFDLNVAWAVPLQIRGTGHIALPIDLVSEDLIAKLGPSVDLNVDLSLDEGYGLAIAPSQIQTAHANVAIEGTLGIRDQTVVLSPELSYDDVNRLLEGPTEGEALPLVARIPLSGTFQELTITPDIDLGGEAWIDGDLQVGLAESINALGEITMRPATAIIPAAYQDLMADGGVVNLDVNYAENRITLSDTVVRVGETSLRATGTVDLDQSLLDMQLDVKAADLHEFEGIAGTPLQGSVRVQLQAKGDGTATTVTGNVGVDQVTASTVQVPTGELALDVTAGGFPDALTDRITTTLKGSFPGIQLQPEVTRDVNIAGEVTLNDLKALTVKALNVSDGNLQVVADGTIDLETRAADFTSEIVVAEIGDYADLAELPYRGAANFKVDVASGDAPGKLVATIDGGLKGIDGLPDDVMDLTGDAIALKAEAHYDGEVALVKGLTLEGAGITAKGQANYHLVEKTLGADIEGRIANLASLSGLAKRPLAGEASFVLKASGPTDDITVQGNVTGDQLYLDTLRAESALLNFKATGIPTAIEADLSATLSEGEKSLVLNTKLAQKDKLITIDGFELLADENTIAAQGALDTTTMQGYGEVLVDLPQLAALNTWINFPLEGSVRLEATLAEATGALTGSLVADEVVVDTTHVGHADGTFDIAQLLDAPSGTIALNVADVDAGDFDVASLTLEAEGPPSGLQLTIQTEGVYQEFTQFKVDGGGLLATEAGSFSLNDLSFGLENHAFVLREAATLSWIDGQGQLTPFVLEGDSGRITVAGRYNAEIVDARAEWKDLSLSLVELVGKDPMAGMMTGAITITGTPEAPQVDVENTLDDYNPEPGDDNDFPGLDADLKAVIVAGSLQADLRASVPEKAEFRADATMPMTLSLSPWNFNVPDGAPLEGSLTGEGDLSVVPPIVGMEGQELRGILKADLTAAGTLSSPGLVGTATVSDGYYENGSSSTILNDLEIRVEAEGNTIRIAKFEGNDTVGGTITGEGQMTLDPDTGSPFDFTLKLDKPRLVHRDDLRTQGAGELRFHGDSSGAKLEGDLAVGPAYIAIPESSGKTEVTTVAYTEAHVAGEAEPEVKKAPYEIALDLALDFPGKVFVTGTGLDSEWDGKLRITNTTADPAVEGVLRVKKGTLDFLGRIFSLAESTITFDGQTPPSPYLRIDAVNTTSEIEAHIRMEGTANNLNLSLESDPPMPQDEILSRVLFGQRLSDVSPVQALTLARYAPMFKKNVSGRSVLGSQGPKPFLVDRISLNSGTEVGEASITTGKYLNEDFYLEFEQGLGSAESLVSLDWLFAPQWSLKGKTTAGGEGGLGVFWKKNY